MTYRCLSSESLARSESSGRAISAYRLLTLGERSGSVSAIIMIQKISARIIGTVAVTPVVPTLETIRS